MAVDPAERKRIGEQGEQLAAAYLESLGYRIVARNFRHRIGEIDIIAQSGEYLVICEVKARKNSSLSPTLSVTVSKQKKLRKMYEMFVLKNPTFLPLQPRFDVISIEFQTNQAPNLEHFPNAF